MDQEYIDEFFETGRLRLSTFRAFSEHEDEERHDDKEGVNMLVGQGNEQTIIAYASHGQQSLIFCTSTIADEQLMNDFGSDGFFKINNSTGFGATIAGKIPGYVSGLEGLCSYQDRRIIEKTVTNLDLDQIKNAEGQVDLDQLSKKAMEPGGPHVFFVKLKKYSHQSEYRFVWNVAQDVDRALFVECPEARQFCERIT